MYIQCVLSSCIVLVERKLTIVSILSVKFHDDADSVAETLSTVRRNLDTKYSQPNTQVPGAVSELLLQLDKEDKQLVQAEKTLSELKQKAPEVVPIKQRRTRAQQPFNLETICDWDSGDVCF